MSYEKLNLYLLKPSKYDDDGYVIRHWKGVLPSNTLACLYGLSEDVRKREVLGSGLKWHVEAIDETVQKVNIRKIIQSSKQKKAKTIVCLVGVQSNQFPRARDLALAFRQAGLDVLMGGFHVSGILSTFSNLSSELTALTDVGVTLVAGEAEGRLETILQDALQTKLKPVYNFLHMPADLSEAPMPEFPPNLMNRYAVKRFTTLDCGRGCPFACSFCTIINVHGRAMRFRPVESIVAWVRDSYAQGLTHYFFTDDNFSRNKNWEAIFDALTSLREQEKMNVSFMMQVDAQSHRISNFIPKAKRAGCSQVYIGMESLNEENLKLAGKKQNQISEFQNLVSAYQAVGIAAHLSYIIGFPFDNEQSVTNDLNRLQSELGAEQASFFMLTPLPGSDDYRKGVAKSMVMDADLNNFDSFHETFQHPRMKHQAWSRAYQEAWKHFYNVENLKVILKKTPVARYWGVFLNAVWYKNAIQVEGGHPMLHGFVRLRSRTERRPDYSQENLWVYFRRRVGDFARSVSGWVKLALEMEEVWLATRRRNPLEERVLLELAQFQKRVTEWRGLRVQELQTLYRRAAVYLRKTANPKLISEARVPNRLWLWFKKSNILSDLLTVTRAPMDHFWKEIGERLKRGGLLQIRFDQVVVMSFREAILLMKFIISLLRGSVLRRQTSG
ncbi:MAG: radical SAM protein [Candidatus Omnitrophica bacterium]|nr:radical SAM protein [Candidatus Omnitrophota bacterium]